MGTEEAGLACPECGGEMYEAVPDPGETPKWVCIDCGYEEDNEPPE